MSQVVDRFLQYVSFDTQSEEGAAKRPSTDKQWELARLLKQELEELGAEQVRLSEYGYIYAEIPSNLPEDQAGKVPALGFISHMDTAPALTGCNVKPQVVKNYDGHDICLNAEKQITMRISEFPFLERYKGQDLITTDGTTLLGADDKAGVAEIMTAAAYLLSHKEIPHGKICIGFTPDEEIGRGADRFEVENFGAQFAYTVDGGELGEVEYENFNAASAVVTIHGCSMHTGDAKQGMVNSMLIGMEYQQMLPTFENPMYTEGYEGFFHLDHFNGDVETSMMKYLIRDHDMEKFEKKKEQMRQIAAFLNQKYGDGTVEIEIRDSYFNMKEKIKPHMQLIDRVCGAMKELDVEPVIRPIRGGTDGARLSYEGLPCPNLCTGGANFHGKYEFISIQSMEKIVELLVKLMTAPKTERKRMTADRSSPAKKNRRVRSRKEIRIMREKLTKSDVEKIQEEIEYRKLEVRPECLEAVKEARAHGDLSENFEYYAAKKDKNQNESRIRYLENMLKNAIVISDESRSDEVGLNKAVTLYMEDDDEEETYKLVTSIRGNSMHNMISIESPLGKAILRHKVGDRVEITTDNGYSYFAEIRKIEDIGDKDDTIRKF